MNVHHGYKVLFVVAILVLELTGCKEEIHQEAPPLIKRVKTMVVSQQQHQVRYFTGLIEANKTLDMNFRVQGELVQLPVKSGKRVKQGQLLAQLKNSQQLITKKSRQASLKKARAEYERALLLIENKAISQASLEALESQYIAAQSAYEQSLEDVEYTYLTAPFSGVISNRYVDNFSRVTSSTKILTLQDIEQYKIKITVPQSIFVRFRSADSVKLAAEIEGFSQPFPLTVDEMSVSQQSSQQLQLALLMSPPKDRRIVTGTSVRVKAEAVIDDKNIILPSHTVLKDEQGHYVYVVLKGLSGSSEVQKRKVTVDGVSQHGVIISNGLRDGERVVIAGVSLIRDGQQVKVGED